METNAEKSNYIAQCENRVFGKKDRLYLMGFAMLWIALFHISYWLEDSKVNAAPFWIKMFAEGQLGVDIFFFLSAYGLEASIERNSVMRFYCNRAKRLFPLYFLFLFILFFTVARDTSVERAFLQGFFQITGISLIKYAHFFSTGFCFDWFTPAIIAIYIFFPVISRVVRYAERKGLMAEIFLLAFVVAAGHWIHMNKHFPLALLAYRLPIIVLGVMTYRHLHNGYLQRVLSLYILGAAFAFLCHEKAIILSLMIPSLLTVFSMTRFELPFRNAVSLIGRYSYEVYLGHIFLVAFFIPSGYVTSVWLLSVITIIGTLAISSFFAVFQESFYRVLNFYHRKK